MIINNKIQELKQGAKHKKHQRVLNARINWIIATTNQVATQQAELIAYNANLLTANNVSCETLKELNTQAYEAIYYAFNRNINVTEACIKYIATKQALFTMEVTNV